MTVTKFKWMTCLVYMDYIIIYSNSVEDHINHVDEILTALARAGIIPQMKKCTFFSEKVEYLRPVLRHDKLEVDNTHTTSLRQSKPTSTKNELPSILGLCNVYRLFNFKCTAYPIKQLLRKGAPSNFTVDKDQPKSLSKRIAEVCSSPIFALPKSNLPYSVDTDASSYDIGSALF